MQVLGHICDRKHDEINLVLKGCSFQMISADAHLSYLLSKKEKPKALTLRAEIIKVMSRDFLNPKYNSVLNKKTNEPATP